MAPWVRKALGNVALAAVVAGVGGGAFVAWRRYGRLNPYQGIGRKRAVDPNAQFQASGVKVRQYHDGKLVLSALAEGLTVGQGRSRIVLHKVKNGVAQTSQGPMQFAGNTAVLQPNVRSVDVSGGVRVKGSDFDISSQQATIKGAIGEIVVPTRMKGRFMGGAFAAESLTHRMRTDYTRIVRPTYSGPLPQDATQGAPTSVKDKTWHFTGDEVVKQGVLQTAKNAWASDEEMVITAPRIVQNSKTKVVTATSEGGVRATYHSAKADIVADRVVIYRDEKKAVCTGHVVVFVRPKKEWDKPLKINDEERGPIVPDIPATLAAKVGQGETLSQAEKDKIDELRSGKNLRDYPMQLAAEEVTYWYKDGERRAIAKNGNPTAFQKFDDGRWRQAWAPEAHYDGEKDMLDLLGGTAKREVHLKNSIEDVTDCFTAKLSTKEDQTEEDEYVQMKSPKGHLIDFDADKPNAGGAKPADPKKTAPPPPATGGPRKP